MGGAYYPSSRWLKSICRAIAEHSSRFTKIIKEPVFRKYFGELDDEKLKTIPQDYPANHPHIGLLRLRSYMAWHLVRERQALQNDFFNRADGRIFNKPEQPEKK